MWHGIKPTRLWYLTGLKHMRNMLNARLTASTTRMYEQRKRKDLLQFWALAVSGAMACAYAFGLFSPPRDCKKKVDFEDPADAKKCTHDPCPPPKPYQRPKPCPPSSE